MRCWTSERGQPVINAMRAVEPLAFQRGGCDDRFVGHWSTDETACGANTVRTTRMTAPMVMHESATLKTGHQPTDDEVDDVAAQEPR